MKISYVVYIKKKARELNKLLMTHNKYFSVVLGTFSKLNHNSLDFQPLDIRVGTILKLTFEVFSPQRLLNLVHPIQDLRQFVLNCGRHRQNCRCCSLRITFLEAIQVLPHLVELKIKTTICGG